MWWLILLGAAVVSLIILAVVAVLDEVRHGKPTRPRVPAEAPGKPLGEAEKQLWVLLRTFYADDCPRSVARAERRAEKRLKREAV